MNEIEYFIFLPVKRFIAGTAKTAWYLLPLILLFAVAEIILILFFGIVDAGIVFGKISDLLLNIFVALLSILTCWCHHVLLARRGNSITRFLCSFAIIMACLMLICETYTLFTDEILLEKQRQTPLIVSTILFAATLFNIPNMAAAPLKQRILIPLFAFCVLATCLITIMPPICLIFKIIILCMGIPLLRKLQHIAPLIISMPPKD